MGGIAKGRISASNMPLPPQKEHRGKTCGGTERGIRVSATTSIFLVVPRLLLTFFPRRWKRSKCPHSQYSGPPLNCIHTQPGLLQGPLPLRRRRRFSASLSNPATHIGSPLFVGFLKKLDWRVMSTTAGSSSGGAASTLLPASVEVEEDVVPMSRQRQNPRLTLLSA